MEYTSTFVAKIMLFRSCIVYIVFIACSSQTVYNPHTNQFIRHSCHLHSGYASFFFVYEQLYYSKETTIGLKLAVGEKYNIFCDIILLFFFIQSDIYTDKHCILLSLCSLKLSFQCRFFFLWNNQI